MAVLGCYLDESVDKGQEKVFCVGAAVGNDRKWEWLNNEWKAILKSEGIKYFKATDCAAMSGEFRKFRKNDREATAIEKRKGEEIRQKLLNRMSESLVSCFGVAIDMEDFREVANTPEKLDAFGRTPFYHCYFLTMRQCAEQIKRFLPDDVLAFGHDEHQNYGEELRKVYNDFKAVNPDIAPHMTTLAPFDDKIWVPIQVADLTASVIRKYTLWEIAKPRPSKPYELRALSEKGTLGIVSVCQRPHLSNFLAEKGLL